MLILPGRRIEFEILFYGVFRHIINFKLIGQVGFGRIRQRIGQGSG